MVQLGEQVHAGVWLDGGQTFDHMGGPSPDVCAEMYGEKVEFMVSDMPELFASTEFLYESASLYATPTSKLAKSIVSM
jgi:hypothetical protein